MSRLVRGNTHSPAASRKGERSELGVATEHGAGKWRLWSIDTSVGGWFSPFPRRWPAGSYGKPEDGVGGVLFGCHAAAAMRTLTASRFLTLLHRLYL